MTSQRLSLVSMYYRNHGFPDGANGKESTCQCSIRGFDFWFDPLEEEMATYFRVLAWKNSIDRGAW